MYRWAILRGSGDGKLTFDQWYANNSHLFDRVSGQAYFDAVKPTSPETVTNIFGNDLGSFLGAGGVPFTPNSMNGSGLGIDYSGGLGGTVNGGGGAYEAGGGQVGYNGNDYSAFSGGPNFLETDFTDFLINAYGTEVAQPFSNADLNTINAEDIKDKGGEPYIGTLSDPDPTFTASPGWGTVGDPPAPTTPNSPWLSPGWNPSAMVFGSNPYFDVLASNANQPAAPAVMSGSKPAAQPEASPPPRRIVDPNNPQTNPALNPDGTPKTQNGGTMPQQTMPDGTVVEFDENGNIVNIIPGPNGTTPGDTGGTQTQTGGTSSDPTGGLQGFLGQLLGAFFGTGGGGGGATAQQTQGQEQTAMGGNATATGGNSTNTNTTGDVSSTIDLTDLVTVGPSTNTVGDLTTGASTATVGNVAGGNANVNTAGTVGDVAGGQGGMGGAGGNVTLSDLLNTAGMFQSGAVSGGAGGSITNSGNLDTSGMFQSGAVQGGQGGSSTVNTAGTVGNVSGGSIASGAVQNDLGGLISSGAFSDLVGNVSGGNLDTSGMFQSGAVQGGNASVNTDGLGNAISSIFEGGGLLDNIIGGGANYAAGEAYKSANKDTLDFIKTNTIDNLAPFLKMGKDQIPNLENEIGNPVQNDVMAGQKTLTGPTAVKTEVNKINPFDAEDPALKYLIDQGTRAVENSRAATGKANSGGTLEALQELGQGAALNRAGELARIGNMRDQASLARDNQYFGQQLGALQGGLSMNDQLYSQLYDQNTQNLAFDQNAYNELAGIVGAGQNAAAGQGRNATANADNINSLLRQNVTTRGAQGYGLYDMLKGIF